VRVALHHHRLLDLDAPTRPRPGPRRCGAARATRSRARRAPSRRRAAPRQQATSNPTCPSLVNRRWGAGSRGPLDLDQRLGDDPDQVCRMAEVRLEPIGAGVLNRPDPGRSNGSAVMWAEKRWARRTHGRCRRRRCTPGQPRRRPRTPPAFIVEWGSSTIDGRQLERVVGPGLPRAPPASCIEPRAWSSVPRWTLATRRCDGEVVEEHEAWAAGNISIISGTPTSSVVVWGSRTDTGRSS